MPRRLKAALNDVGGYRNTMTLVLPGLDIEAKAALDEQQLFGMLGDRDRFADIDVRLLRFDRPDAQANDRATAHLRVTVKIPVPKKVGRAFSGRRATTPHTRGCTGSSPRTGCGSSSALA